jgi:thiamine kinase-like enzyme
MKIPGNSRALVKFDTLEKEDVVVKSVSLEDLDRLSLQIQKQIDYIPSHGIRTPRVISRCINSGRFEVVMEFVRGLDFVSFTNTASAEEFERVVSKLIFAVQSHFKSATLENFPIQVWTKKVQSLSSAALQKSIDQSLVSKMERFLVESAPEKILMGPCHGDLTFSNVIVERDGSVCVFDFLDPPIDTPVEDVSKLLQDAEFYWTLKKFSGDCDRTRVQIMWSHARKMILQEFLGIISQRDLAVFQVMTLARIIPYTSDQDVIDYLVKCIMRKINETDLTMRR